MKVNVSNISNQGRIVRLNDTDDWCVKACNQGAEGHLRKLSGELKLISHADHVEVKGHFSAQVERRCDRCDEVTLLTLQDAIGLRYYPQPTALNQELELSVDDLGVGWYEKGALLPEDVLCEVISLSIPNRVLCLDASNCDMRFGNLRGDSQVDRLTGHPAFAALKGSGSGPVG